MRVLVTGASRGIGAAIARRFAFGKNASVAVLGRSLDAPSHPPLHGTLRETADAIELCGGKAFPYQVDMRDGEAVTETVASAIRDMGGLDVLINNASVLAVGPSADTPKSMQLLSAVNTHATMLCLNTARPALEESAGNIVTLSPPIRLARLDWIQKHGVSYTLSKYSMTLATLASATRNVYANCVWPKYCVATAATYRLEREGVMRGAHSNGRPAEDTAEAVYRVAVTRRWNASALLDEDVYDMPPAHPLAPLDAYVTEPSVPVNIN